MTAYRLDGHFCTLADLAAWEGRAQPGDTLAYFTGRSLANVEPHVTADEADALNRVRLFYNLGRLDLTQRRLTSGRDSVFEYRATWRDHPATVAKEGRLVTIQAEKARAA